MPTQRASPTAAPVSATQRWRGQQATTMALRLGGLLVLLVLVGLLTLPSPILGYHWRLVVFRPVAPALRTPFPGADMPVPAFIPVVPVYQWMIWIVVGLLGYGAVMLGHHLVMLRMQQVVPLSKERQYYRIRMPASATTDKAQGVALLRSLHGMVPSPQAITGAGVPLVLRWTGAPDLPVQQGVSLLVPAAQVVSVTKTIEGVAEGTLVEAGADPLRTALRPGDALAWCALRPAAGDAIPLAIPPREQSPLLDGLLPAMSPPAGVRLTDVQIMVRPVAQITTWRLRVLSMAERLKVDVQSDEQKALNRKAEGPGFDVTMRVIVIADQPDLAQGYLTVLTEAFSASAQTVGVRQQRLRATRAQVIILPDPPLPPPRPAKKTNGKKPV